MKTLTANYGYDCYDLELTDIEAKLIAEKKEFTKRAKVWRETTSMDEETIVDATWTFNPDENSFTIERDDGAIFYADTYSIY